MLNTNTVRITVGNVTIKSRLLRILFRSPLIASPLHLSPTASLPDSVS